MSRDVLTRRGAGPYTGTDFPRGVAQSVARGVWDAEVGGSSPLTPTFQDIMTIGTLNAEAVS